MVPISVQTLLTIVYLASPCIYASKRFYTAAVYEHALNGKQSSSTDLSRELSLEYMNSNLDVLESQAKLAKEQVCVKKCATAKGFKVLLVNFHGIVVQVPSQPKRLLNVIGKFSIQFSASV